MNTRKTIDKIATTLQNNIQQLAHHFEQEDNAKYDLWTWLPSHECAKRSHGDYASEFTPDTEDVMKEACMVLAELKGHGPSEAEKQEWYRCPCDECEEAVYKNTSVVEEDNKETKRRTA